jgi:flagellar biosynthesis protein FlhG
VIDAGNGLSRWAHRLWQTADAVLVVATPELPAVMDAYAAIKVLAVGDESIPVHTVVNLAPEADTSDDVQRRLGRVCQRFLGRRLFDAGSIPPDPLVGQSGRLGEPLLTAFPRSPAAREIRSLAGLMALRMKLAGSALDRSADSPQRMGKK